MISKLASQTDIEACIDIYFTRYHSAYAADIPKCRQSFYNYLKSGATCLVQRNGAGEIVAWILAIQYDSDISALKTMKVQFLGSSLSGLAAARAIVRLHEAVYEIAKKRHFHVVISSCSHRDEDMLFSKILEHAGWHREGYMVMKFIRTMKES